MKSQELLAKNIAGEIILSTDPGSTIRKWREIFGINQRDLAQKLSISPSVVSDYESGRRKSPGSGFVKKIVEKLIEMDMGSGGKTIKKFSVELESEAILDIRELLTPIPASTLVKAVKGQVVANKKLLKTRSLWGYTVIDSIKAILSMSESDFIKIYGSTTERALVFTKVGVGRSPMIAIKVTKPRPSVVILHGLKPYDVDKIALHIAKVEKIPLVVSTLESETDLINKLRDKIR